MGPWDERTEGVGPGSPIRNKCLGGSQRGNIAMSNGLCTGETKVTDWSFFICDMCAYYTGMEMIGKGGRLRSCHNNFSSSVQTPDTMTPPPRPEATCPTVKGKKARKFKKTVSLVFARSTIHKRQLSPSRCSCPPLANPSRALGMPTASTGGRGDIRVNPAPRREGELGGPQGGHRRPGGQGGTQFQDCQGNRRPAGGGARRGGLSPCGKSRVFREKNPKLSPRGGTWVTFDLPS